MKSLTIIFFAAGGFGYGWWLAGVRHEIVGGMKEVKYFFVGLHHTLMERRSYRITVGVFQCVVFAVCLAAMVADMWVSSAFIPVGQ